MATRRSPPRIPGLTAPEPRATLVWNENFETNALGTIFNGGTGGTIAVVTSPAPYDGSKSLRCGSATSCWGLHNMAASGISVHSFWIRNNGAPSQGVELYSPIGAGLRFGVDQATGKFGIVFGTSQTMTYLSTVTPVVGTWYRVDMRINTSANPWVVDWMINGVAQTQLTNAVAAQTAQGIYVGHSTGYSATVDTSFDDIQVSYTSSDYPLSTVQINVAPSGGIVLGGTRTTTKTVTSAPSSGIRLGGSAATSVQGAITRAPTGGIILGGQAATARSSSKTPAGGVVLGGAAAITRGMNRATAGGVVLGGSVLTRFLGPVLVTAPVVSGSVQQGQVLTCSPGTWSTS